MAGPTSEHVMTVQYVAKFVFLWSNKLNIAYGPFKHETDSKMADFDCTLVHMCGTPT